MLTWEMAKEIKKIAGMPLIIKGIATAEDAKLAVDHGVDVIYISNHGGRQLDHGLGTIDTLPEIAARGERQSSDRPRRRNHPRHRCRESIWRWVPTPSPSASSKAGVWARAVKPAW